MKMDSDSRKKQFTQDIVSDIKSKIKEFKIQKEQARSERSNELDIEINKELINKFRKGNNIKIESLLPSSKNANDTNNQQFSSMNHNNFSSVNKNEQINNKINLLKRHFSQESNTQRNISKNNNTQIITNNTKSNEIIQSLIPKPKPYTYKTKYQINNNNNINQISFLKLHSGYNSNYINSQQHNTSFHKDNKINNYTTLTNNNNKTNSINKDINIPPPYITYKTNLSLSKLQPNKVVNPVTKSVLNRLSNSHSKQINKELEEFSDFSIGNSYRKDNYSKGKSSAIYTTDIKPLLTKIKSLNNDDIQYIDKPVFDDLITLANVIKMKFNY